MINQMYLNNYKNKQIVRNLISNNDYINRDINIIVLPTQNKRPSIIDNLVYNNELYKNPRQSTANNAYTNIQNKRPSIIDNLVYNNDLRKNPCQSTANNAYTNIQNKRPSIVEKLVYSETFRNGGPEPKVIYLSEQNKYDSIINDIALNKKCNTYSDRQSPTVLSVPIQKYNDITKNLNENKHFDNNRPANLKESNTVDLLIYC